MPYDNLRPVPRGYPNERAGIVEMRIDFVADTDEGEVTVASLSVEDCELLEADCRPALLRASRQQIDEAEPLFEEAMRLR